MKNITQKNPQTDYSQEEFPPDMIWEMLPFREILIKTMTLAPVILFGILGNALLIYIIYRNQALHTATNSLIFNMAVADLLSLIVNPVLFLFEEIFQNYKLGVFGCKLEAMVEGTFLVTSVITLCFISKDRLTAIAFPTENRLNRRTVKYAIASTWTVGLALSIPFAVFRHYHERQWINFLECFCVEDMQILLLYWHILLIALVWIPSAVLIFCYATIFWKLRKHEQKLKKRNQNFPSRNQLQRSYKKKLAVTSFIVVVSFVVLRIPFSTFVFIRYNRYHDDESSEIGESLEFLWYTARYLIFVDCALTPVIYGVMNENFRKAIRLTWIYSCCCKLKVARRIEVFTISKNRYEVSQQSNFHETQLNQKADVIRL